MLVYDIIYIAFLITFRLASNKKDGRVTENHSNDHVREKCGIKLILLFIIQLDFTEKAIIF